jgi:hypothetical protein
VAEIVSLQGRRASTETSAKPRSAQAHAAAELVRSIGLSGLVRPATTSTSLATSEVPAVAESDVAPSITPMVDGALAVAIEPPMVLPGTFPLHGEPDRILPVSPQLRELLPSGGLRRGSTVGVTGATSLLIGLLSEASQSGSWCAIVGLPTLGAVAAAEAGVVLDRAALVPYPGTEWTAIVAALLDGFDIVVASPPGPIAPNIASRLAARARQRGSVLVTYGQMPGVDVTLHSSGSRWSGLDQGRGRLLRRELTVVARGRGAAARSRVATIVMPAHSAMNAGWTPRADWASRDIDARPDLTLVPDLC